MWIPRTDRHCSDDALLAYLDGELSGYARIRTGAHLRRCWECRAHLTELEQQAETLARMARNPRGGQADRTAAARDAFLAWRQGYEKKLTTSPAPTRRAPLARWSLAAAGVCALLAAAAVFLPRPRAPQPSQPAAADILRGVTTFQNELRRQPGAVHQVLRVEVVQTRPAPRQSKGRVEIWSDSAGGRYASRWIDEGRTLKYAVWRQKGRPPVVYGAASEAAAGALIDPRTDNLTVEGLERAFFDWLRAQDWQAAPGWSEVVARDGAAMRVERLGDGGFRIHVSRTGKAIRADFVIDVEAGTFRPRLQVMRFENDGRALEVRVASDRLEVVPMARVDGAVFEPDRSRLPLPPSAPPLDERLPAPTVPPAPGPAVADDLEAEVFYAIHRVRACVGDNVQVSTGPGGEVRVRAMVQNAERRAELAEALQQAAGSRLRAEILVVGYRRPGPERTNPLLPVSGVRMVDGLYREALALVRLSERFSPDKTGKLKPAQRRLVDLMVRDHVAALRSGSRTTRAEVEPLLVSLAGAAADAPAVAPAANWAVAAVGIFHALDQADTLIDAPPGAARRPAAARLLGALAELEQRVKQLDGAVAALER
jgi:anti-sigma factor RsiW